MNLKQNLQGQGLSSLQGQGSSSLQGQGSRNLGVVLMARLLMARLLMFSVLIGFLACTMASDSPQAEGLQLQQISASEVDDGLLVSMGMDPSTLSAAQKRAALGSSATTAFPAWQTVYRGIYSAPDGDSVEVYFLLHARDSTASTPRGSVNRLAVILQGGTGSHSGVLLSDAEGLGNSHSAALLVNYRGANAEELAPSGEVAVGPNFVRDFIAKPSISLVNPKRNARDVIDIVKIFQQGQSIRVGTQEMNAGQLLPQGIRTDAIDLYTASFGGVVFAYMLPETDRPTFNNVFLEQVTSPTENTISSGPTNLAKMYDHLFDACEADTTCNAAYPNMRSKFQSLLNEYAAAQVSVDGVMRYAGSISELVFTIAENEREGVGKAIRFLGEMTLDYAANSNPATAIDVPTAMEPAMETLESVDTQPNSQITNAVRSSYGLPNIDGLAIRNLLGMRSYFPGITNRTAYICSAIFNREQAPDSQEKYTQVLAADITEDSATGATALKYETYAYGFLVWYKQYTRICPMLRGSLESLTVPSIAASQRIPANRILIFSGGLDIKHESRALDFFTNAFVASSVHSVDQRFLSQAVGQDRGCLRAIKRSFWTNPDALGDDCTESNTFTASQLTGW